MKISCFAEINFTWSSISFLQRLFSYLDRNFIFCGLRIYVVNFHLSHREVYENTEYKFIHHMNIISQFSMERFSRLIVSRTEKSVETIFKLVSYFCFLLFDSIDSTIDCSYFSHLHLHAEFKVIAFFCSSFSRLSHKSYSLHDRNNMFFLPQYIDKAILFRLENICEVHRLTRQN